MKPQLLLHQKLHHSMQFKSQDRQDLWQISRYPPTLPPFVQSNFAPACLEVGSPTDKKMRVGTQCALSYHNMYHHTMTFSTQQDQTALSPLPNQFLRKSLCQAGSILQDQILLLEAVIPISLFHYFTVRNVRYHKILNHTMTYSSQHQYCGHKNAQDQIPSFGGSLYHSPLSLFF